MRILVYQNPRTSCTMNSDTHVENKKENAEKSQIQLKKTQFDTFLAQYDSLLRNRTKFVLTKID